MAPPSNFGTRLRWVLRSADISASSLSEAAGVSRDFARKVSKGEIADPGIEMARRLAVTLGVSLEWLASGDGEQPSDDDLAAAAERVRAATAKRTGTDGG